LPRLVNKLIGAEFFIVLSPGKVEGVKFFSGADELRDATQRIQDAKIVVPFPEGSKAEMLRRGALFCSPDLHQCEFT
jgi:hypothetical protein